MVRYFFAMKNREWDSYNGMVDEKDLKNHIEYIKRNTGLKKVHYKIIGKIE